MSLYQRMQRLADDETAHPLARASARQVIADMLRFNLVAIEDLV